MDRWTPTVPSTTEIHPSCFYHSMDLPRGGMRFLSKRTWEGAEHVAERKRSVRVGDQSTSHRTTNGGSTWRDRSTWWAWDRKRPKRWEDLPVPVHPSRSLLSTAASRSVEDVRWIPFPTRRPIPPDPRRMGREGCNCSREGAGIEFPPRTQRNPIVPPLSLPASFARSGGIGIQCPPFGGKRPLSPTRLRGHPKDEARAETTRASSSSRSGRHASRRTR